MLRREGTIRLTAALLALLLSGCVSFGAPAEDERPQSAMDAPVMDTASAPALAALPGPDETPRIPAAMRFPEVWLRPLQDQVGILDAPGATQARWYVGVEGIHPTVRFVAGRPYVTAEAGRASAHPAGTGAIDPGEAAVMRMVERGRHIFAIPSQPEARFVLSVVPDAPEAASVNAFLVDGGDGARFLPERIAVRPGTRVVFLNQGPAQLEVARADFQPWIGAGAAPMNVTPVDEGMYTLVAEVADDAGATGEARARFLVDLDRPSTRRDVGPVDGTFTTGTLPAGPAPEERVHVEAEYPVSVLRLTANASSILPGPAAVRVQLLRGDELMGEMVTGASEGVTLLDLPAGEYTLRVSPDAGQIVRYEAFMRLTYRLPVPPALRDG